MICTAFHKIVLILNCTQPKICNWMWYFLRSYRAERYIRKTVCCPSNHLNSSRCLKFSDNTEPLIMPYRTHTRTQFVSFCSIDRTYRLQNAIDTFWLATGQFTLIKAFFECVQYVAPSVQPFICSSFHLFLYIFHWPVLTNLRSRKNMAKFWFYYLCCPFCFHTEPEICIGLLNLFLFIISTQ